MGKSSLCPDFLEEQHEQEAWLAYKRNTWKNWADVLARIKQDEQRWLTNCVIVYGGICAFLVKGVNDQLFSLSSCNSRVLFLILLFLINHGVAWIWTAQALILRKQYYRTLVRLFETQISMGDRGLPKAWRTDDFDEWYKDATFPRDSKFVEMLTLSAFVCIAQMLAAARVWFAENGLLQHDCCSLFLLGLFALSGLCWALLVYPCWDKAKLREIHTLQLKSIEGCAEDAREDK